MLGHRRRCRDFNERGACLRGELCKFDHGPAPLVVQRDDATSVTAPFSWPVPPPAAAGGQDTEDPCQPDFAGPTANGRPGSPPLGLALPPPPPRQPGAAADGEGAAGGTGDPRTLELRRVPAELNQIRPLASHLARFGRVLHIQVGLGGDPESALVTFSSAEEAAAALSSAELLLPCAQVTVLGHAAALPERLPAAARQQSERNVTPLQQSERAVRSLQQNGGAVRRAQDLQAASDRLQAKRKEGRQRVRLMAERARLDLELELFQRQKAGVDTEPLQRRLAELRPRPAKSAPSGRPLVYLQPDSSVAPVGVD
ncbi:RNA-binding protein 26-like [Pollicipes pollicipes]|uniref:RNA-binding protein 26-like n=1 Tax=Pollicipes pollicipes TaxID=41117 RepID=UPI0018849673|nr:RNA-binding protein 26-like [Pollicipes pollicipes]